MLEPWYIRSVKREAYAPLEARLTYQFSDITNLVCALTHKSYVNENPTAGCQDNERLEFLGDALLGFVAGALLMESFPLANEGELSKARAQVVNEHGLVQVAEAVDLGEWLFLGKGEEQSGGRQKTSILADACEAVLAAIFLDGGFAVAREVISRLFAEQLRVALARQDDFKTCLQEYAQNKFHLQPRYLTVAETGPAHDRLFEVTLSLGEREYARAYGKSKKEAEQRAAESALRELTGGKENS